MKENETNKVNSDRLIQFRAWDHFNETMWTQNGLGNFFTSMEKFASGGNKITFMQYTGLKDKNSKEIYEGDIFIPDGWALDSRQAMHVVVYEPILAAYFTSPLTQEAKESSVCLQGFGIGGTVIGNIYESPELLNNG